MRVAAYGDIHGHWLDFKESVLELHSREPLDLVLQCGDAQPFRDEADLEYMHCPSKYREMGAGLLKGPLSVRACNESISSCCQPVRGAGTLLLPPARASRLLLGSEMAAAHLRLLARREIP